MDWKVAWICDRNRNILLTLKNRHNLSNYYVTFNWIWRNNISNSHFRLTVNPGKIYKCKKLPLYKQHCSLDWYKMLQRIRLIWKMREKILLLVNLYWCFSNMKKIYEKNNLFEDVFCSFFKRCFSDINGP